ncbi:ABC transporter ATP-binding protein [Amycolatopsis sp. PS_44_ISF1]|uniref:ABC transporter ATP-binding protein n=1 Tax=Amycolatopsis sp. PS_44_ISF1 TaxID=2974917 RepID=UPI0028DDBFC6|nr:ABC transporter ATP-binding protein [Amycolatopsis sp. PS_44_ISF1]MDT8909759.1 ABC transporter ATP-binding protein/permease [Amycolatopsis sp. PS_44_ISF1]
MTAPPEPASPPASLVSLLRPRLRPYRRPLAAIAGFQLVQAAALLYLPTLNADVVDRGVLTGDVGYILGHGGIMLAATLVQIGCAGGAVLLGARVAMGLGADLRTALFDRVSGFSAREMSRFGASSLLTRSTNDVQQVQLLLFTALAMLLTAPFVGTGGVVLAVRQDAPSSLALLVAVPVGVVTIGLLIRQMVPASRLLQRFVDAVNRVMREQITGIRVIRAFVRDENERKRFADANTDLMGVGVRLGRVQAFFGATSLLISNLASVAVLAIGGHRVVGGELQLGALIAFLTYLTLTLGAVTQGLSVFMMAPRAKVSAGRITEVLDTEPGIAEPAVPVGVAAWRGNLELDGVTFGYPGAERPVLRGVSLTARPGRTTAIIGSTGSGKTTLITVLARLLEVDEGAVRIDGVDVRDVARGDLSRQIGLVPQRAYLFAGTIADNLRYGDPDADEARLWHALEIAQAAEFVRALPDGLDTAIGQGGSTVSGGQRQRLAIARVLLARPRIYLFDDAFSALDNATEAALRTALAREIGDATVVVVAQRVSTIRTAETIVVLEAGLVEATGTHEELLATSTTYAQIVDSQLTVGEAA